MTISESKEISQNNNVINNLNANNNSSHKISSQISLY